MFIGNFVLNIASWSFNDWQVRQIVFFKSNEQYFTYNHDRDKLTNNKS